MSAPKWSVYSSKSDEDFWEYGYVKEEPKVERNSIIDRSQTTATVAFKNQSPKSPGPLMDQKMVSSQDFLNQKPVSDRFTGRKSASPEIRRILVQSKELALVTEAEETEKLFQEELRAMEESEKSNSHALDIAWRSRVTGGQTEGFSLKQKDSKTGSEEESLVSPCESDISIITLTNEIRPQYNPEVRGSLRSPPSPSGSMITVISMEDNIVEGNENRSNRDMMYPSDLPKPRIAFREEKKPGLFGIIRRQISRVGRFFRKRVGALSCI